MNMWTELHSRAGDFFFVSRELQNLELPFSADYFMKWSCYCIQKYAPLYNITLWHRRWVPCV